MVNTGVIMDKFVVPAFEVAKSNGNTLALVAALGLVLRYALAKTPSLLISDLGKVGHLEGEAESTENEFDIIIVGGGECHSFLALYLLLIECRYGWLCACISSVRRSLHPRSDVGMWRQVRYTSLFSLNTH